jgi:long-chain-fatty-acid--CoA ligase ACSBG
MVTKIIFIIVALIILFTVYRAFSKQPTHNLINQMETVNFLDKFEQISIKYPKYPALKYKDNESGVKSNIWKTISYKKYYDICIKFSNIIKGLHIPERSSICMMGNNSPEYMISHLGSIMANCISVGIYTSNQKNMCEYILENCGCHMLILENEELLEKVMEYINSEKSKIRMVVVYSPTNKEEFDTFCKNQQDANLITSWKKLMKSNLTKEIIDPTSETNNIDDDDVAVLIYTSGTTSDPKGAMISINNINGALYSIINGSQIQLKHNQERSLSYLPLNHIAAQILDIYLPIYICGTVWIADKFALKDSLLDNLKACEPTIFTGVPRVWEKIMEKLENIRGKQNKYLINLLDISNYFGVYSKIIKKNMGLNKCNLFITTAAPLPNHVKKYFSNININLKDAYGLSETTGPITFDNIILPRINIKLDQQTNEIMINGKNIFKGYYLNKKNTKAVIKKINNKKWFMTGDLGKIKKQKNGKKKLLIIGRKKEMIITTGGENIMPVPIESSIKKNIQGIEHAVVIGDKRKFITCLITLKKSFIDKHKNDDNINNLIKIGIENVNNTANSKVNKIKKWTILDNSFSINGTELTPTMKLRRSKIYEKYAKEIDKMYNS